MLVVRVSPKYEEVHIFLKVATTFRCFRRVRLLRKMHMGSWPIAAARAGLIEYAGTPCVSSAPCEVR